MTPKIFNALIPEPGDVTTQQRDLADRIKVKDLEMGDYPGLSEWTLNVNTMLLTQWMQS